MSRFISWLAIGVGAAFLVVSTAAFPPSSTAWLAFAISIGTLILSTGLAYSCRAHAATRAASLLIAAVSGWTIVASLVFSPSTVQDLALAGSLAIAGLALVGITANELANESVLAPAAKDSSAGESRLAAAA
jgi:low temperature requirement protein LtrA